MLRRCFPRAGTPATQAGVRNFGTLTWARISSVTIPAAFLARGRATDSAAHDATVGSQRLDDSPKSSRMESKTCKLPSLAMSARQPGRTFPNWMGHSTKAATTPLAEVMNGGITSRATICPPSAPPALANPPTAVRLLRRPIAHPDDLIDSATTNNGPSDIEIIAIRLARSTNSSSCSVDDGLSAQQQAHVVPGLSDARTHRIGPCGQQRWAPRAGSLHGRPSIRVL